MGRVERRFLKDKEVATIVGVSRATIWRWVKRGTFPVPHELGPNTTAWARDEVDTWLTQRTGANTASLPAENNAPSDEAKALSEAYEKRLRVPPTEETYTSEEWDAIWTVFGELEERRRRRQVRKQTKEELRLRSLPKAKQIV